MSRNVAMFDMDSSLFDYEGSLRKSLESLQGPNDPPLENNVFEYEDISYMRARIKLIRSVPGWWENLPPLEDGFKIFNLAKEMGFDCHILTKGPRSNSRAWMEKLNCCQKHFGSEIQVHICMDKSLTHAKVLYDDYPVYMENWLNNFGSGLGIMPLRNHNPNFQHARLIKWDGNNLSEVEQALKKAYSTKSIMV